MGKETACNAGDVGSLPESGRSLGGGMATHSSIVWRILWTEKPGGLQSMGSQRIEHNWSDLAQLRQHNLLNAGLSAFSFAAKLNQPEPWDPWLPMCLFLGYQGMLVIPHHASLLPKESLCLEHPGLSYPHPHKSARKSSNGFRDHVLLPLLSIHKNPLQAPLPP